MKRAKEGQSDDLMPTRPCRERTESGIAGEGPGTITIGGHHTSSTRFLHYGPNGDLFLDDSVDLVDPRWGMRFGTGPVSQVVVGRTPIMLQLFQAIRQLAVCDLAVLVRGESGTGKELIAAAIASVRGKPFVIRNCAAVSPELLESELFGHVKGAFTGATTDRKGWFEAADGGTLFLDEIGYMPLSMQVRLLRVIEDGDVIPVGSNDATHVDVRIVSATNQDLISLVRQKEFRAELLVRLRGVEVSIAPLRERKEDIPLLVAHHLLASRSRFTRRIERVPAETFQRLSSYDYPYNVRELFIIVDRPLALHEGRVLTPEEIAFDANDCGGDILCHTPPRTARSQTSHMASKYRGSAIIDALEASPHMTVELARLLGCSQRTVQRAIRKLVAQGRVVQERDGNDPRVLWYRKNGRQG
jgi:transcriptional regulator with GAF, ATPase, and Fis domain